jgi:hypothetical protein
MLSNEIGYEHYFQNYLLYLPYSQQQEIMSITEALNVMSAMGIIDIHLKEDIDTLLNKVQLVMRRISEYNKLDNKVIKEILSKSNPIAKGKDDLIQYIIYGDYKYRNEEVEIYLHQRTMKKIKYKKREFEQIHPINEKVLSEVQKRMVFNDSSNDNAVNDKLKLEYNKIKSNLTI